MVAPPFERQFWLDKRVLITGHSGFKGGWLTLWLQRLGAKVSGISLPPATTPNLFTLAALEKNCDSQYCDICNATELAACIRDVAPEIIFHLAAQPLVQASYFLPVQTFATNVMGSVHLLEAVRGLACVKTVIMVTTDKVYRNNEWSWPYREEDALGGHDPYSASKAASEIVIASYRNAFLNEQGVAVATARAGNVIGGGDWSKDRLIPDTVRAWQAGRVLHIRCPDASRPWQHVLEPLAGYLALARQLHHKPELAGAYNFGPETSEAATVRTVVELAKTEHPGGEVCYGDGGKGMHEARSLALEIAKARMVLGVRPRWALAQAVARTMAWYRAQQSGADAHTLCKTDIADYEAVA
jgi:CDP-glucose 4,6-dehydratase